MMTLSPPLLSAQQRESFQADGYLLVRGLFEPAMIEQFKAFFAELAARRHELPPSKFVLEEDVPAHAAPLSHIRKINELHLHPETLPFYGAQGPVAPLAAQLIGGDNSPDELLFSSSAFTKAAGHGSQTPWHQDQALWSMWLGRAVSCWVALDNCTPENGCLQFVRASHLDGYEPHVSTPETAHPHIPKARVPQQRVEVMPMEMGDGVFFGGLTWHYSDSNNSPARRLGMTAVYNCVADQSEGRAVVEWANNRTGGFNGDFKAPLREWIKTPMGIESR